MRRTRNPITDEIARKVRRVTFIRPFILKDLRECSHPPALWCWPEYPMNRARQATERCIL
jgi:hypothetical protein